MYWEESKPQHDHVIPDDVVDLAFDIACRCLNVDHAYRLSQEIVRALPWMGTEPGVGIHPIHVAESGNGWTRPENPTDLLYLSRRTKLVLRIPKQRVDDARVLSGKSLDIDGNSLRVEAAHVRPLSAIATIFARHLVIDAAEDEEQFLRTALARLAEMDIHPKKMLCGKRVAIVTPHGAVHTRSLMLANLTLEESTTLQLRGLGAHRLLGCGLFIGHRDINEVKQKTG